MEMHNDAADCFFDVSRTLAVLPTKQPAPHVLLMHCDLIQGNMA